MKPYGALPKPRRPKSRGNPPKRFRVAIHVRKTEVHPKWKRDYKWDAMEWRATKPIPSHTKRHRRDANKIARESRRRNRAQR